MWDFKPSVCLYYNKPAQSLKTLSIHGTEIFILLIEIFRAKKVNKKKYRDADGRCDLEKSK